MLNQKNLSNKRLSLTSIGLLIVSIFLIFGARIIVSQLSLMAVLSTPELFAYVPAFCVAGYVLMAAGVAGFLYVGLRSRFQVDTQRIKTQSRKLKFSIVALTCLMMCTSFLMTAPIVSANTVATTGYYLATPLPIADWYLGNYSTGNIFAINGSSWANLMTYPAAAPWASVTGNYTAVWENVLAATSYGTIYAKEVAFPLSLHTTIPNNTQVICNYQGVTYTFTNSTNSMGSPYTVETGAVKYDTTMYTAKDSGNRILWSSTDAANLLTTTLTYGDIFVKGNLTVSDTFYIPSYRTIDGDGQITLAANSNCNILENLNPTTGNTGITVKNVIFEGNKDSQTLGYGVYFKNVSYTTIQQLTTNNFKNDGIYLDNTGIVTDGYNGRSYAKILDSTANNNDGCGINVKSARYFCEVSGNTANLNAQSGVVVYDAYMSVIDSNTACYNTIHGLYLNLGAENTISNNIIGANTQKGFELYACFENSITGNTITANNIGLRVYASYGNQIVANILRDNQLSNLDIEHIQSDNNTVAENTLTNIITYGTDYGARVLTSGCENNKIINNNFANYDVAAITSASASLLIEGNEGFCTEYTGSIAVDNTNNVFIDHLLVGYCQSAFLSLEYTTGNGYASVMWVNNNASRIQVFFSAAVNGTLHYELHRYVP